MKFPFLVLQDADMQPEECGSAPEDAQDQTQSNTRFDIGGNHPLETILNSMENMLLAKLSTMVASYRGMLANDTRKS